MRRLTRAVFLGVLLFTVIWGVQVLRDAARGRVSWPLVCLGWGLLLLWWRRLPGFWREFGVNTFVKLEWLGSPRGHASTQPEASLVSGGWRVNERDPCPVEVFPVLNIGPCLLLRLLMGDARNSPRSRVVWVWLSPRQGLDPVSLHHLRALVYVSRMNRQMRQGDIRPPYKAPPTKVASCPTMSSRDNGSKRPTSPPRRS